MKKLFYSAFVAFVCLALVTSCQKDDDYIASPNLSDLTSHYEFAGASDNIRIFFHGIDSNTNEPIWDFYTGKNFENTDFFLDYDNINYQIKYTKQEKNKANFSYTIEYKYLSFTEEPKTGTTTGNLDLTFTKYEDDIIFDRYIGTASGTKDGQSVTDIDFVLEETFL